jgi:hypothetical protein
MRIAKPLLLISTPLGVVGGLREAWRFNHGLAFLMAAMLLVVSVAAGSVVAIVRRERGAEQERGRPPAL